MSKYHTWTRKKDAEKHARYLRGKYDRVAIRKNKRGFYTVYVYNYVGWK